MNNLGNMSFVTITARTDVTVGFMPKNVLDKYVEIYPNVLLCLSKRLVNQLPPIVFHIDVALEWGQVYLALKLDECRASYMSSR